MKEKHKSIDIMGQGLNIQYTGFGAVYVHPTPKCRPARLHLVCLFPLICSLLPCPEMLLRRLLDHLWRPAAVSLAYIRLQGAVCLPRMLLSDWSLALLYQPRFPLRKSVWSLRYRISVTNGSIYTGKVSLAKSMHREHAPINNVGVKQLAKEI